MAMNQHAPANLMNWRLPFAIWEVLVVPDDPIISAVG
jgi:hypothetical protein